MTTGEIAETVALMRKLGIHHLKVDGLELSIVITEFNQQDSEDAESKLVSQIDKPLPRGKDGLTLDVQAELYGREID